MFGVVFETTQAGRTPVEGVVIAVLSCSVTNCPSSSSVSYETTTDKDGAYRLADLHHGELNFLWILKEGYAAAGPIPVQSCDWCDRIVTVAGDTRLDVELVRR